ncbi:DUF2263 domain-containing protein [Fluoribacter dumoffii]|uniref:poly(ADP-ribose) glycohydrolase domain-containing protein n=1 Tax=Fluoribacter dumoffii TaxID=463 RepID=UPI002243AC45|nr:poly(ADP-ribose) glycohydrolase domain-containing protein [Fluoribacter dumoffii]MCW8387704.1 DUF2263 domain-containing protein [Fluoribacter dumoffii]MCW8497907.1 DUF2263 domain-containing protein [Fluoribacter dumoffii]
MFLRFFRGRATVRPSEFASILSVHESHKPGLLSGSLSGDRWRHESMGKTLNVITDHRKAEELKRQALTNLSSWTKTKSTPPSEVEVVYKDWGDAAFEATKKYARIYSILNMANSRYPGGGALEGGSAQEENMWHRSTCVLSLLENIVKPKPESTEVFEYTPEGRELIEGRRKMTEEELAILKEICLEAYSPDACKTYYSVEPRICFRGPEVLIEASMDDYNSNKFPDPEISFSFLPSTSIFPFHELRSAAPEHFSEPQSQAPEVVRAHRDDLRRRIAAQLDTLIVAKQPNAMFGAWGCGEFKNEPEIIAEIYAEEIEKRSSFFQHIMFPIINTHSLNNNFEIFQNVLAGIKLGETTKPQHSPKG